MRLPRSLPGRYDRATFLTQSALVLLGAASAGAAPSPPWKGRKSSRVKRWDVITVGNLARNRTWGESEAKPLRSTLCTCTVVQGEGFRLIVDPSEGNADDMARELDRRTGLKPREITAAFVTHRGGGRRRRPHPGLLARAPRLLQQRRPRAFRTNHGQDRRPGRPRGARP